MFLKIKNKIVLSLSLLLFSIIIINPNVHIAKETISAKIKQENLAISMHNQTNLNDTLLENREYYYKEYVSKEIENKETISNSNNDSIIYFKPSSSLDYRERIGETYEFKSLGTFRLTYYCPCVQCCGQWSNVDNPITATGAPAIEGVTIAVDPRVIPYGTEVIIDGHTYIAQDCGGAIKDNHIDIYMNSHQKALSQSLVSAEVFIKTYN